VSVASTLELFEEKDEMICSTKLHGYTLLILFRALLILEGLPLSTSQQSGI
jgi:hypothetical protein